MNFETNVCLNYEKPYRRKRSSSEKFCAIFKIIIFSRQKYENRKEDKKGSRNEKIFNQTAIEIECAWSSFSPSFSIGVVIVHKTKQSYRTT